MPRTIEKTVYTFDELSDSAKERARDWYREGALDYAWWDHTYEDARRLGIEITEFDLGSRQSCTIERGWSVGSVAAIILSDHGKDCDTYKLAQEYYRMRRNPGAHMDDDYFWQQLSECYRIMLEREYEYLLSDECVDDCIVGNGYEFTEEGEWV